ncbi:hypothetical protein RclHR1_28360004 [Rhizophagus clarus]|uniref:FAR1 domain-containing protein n=1 Tax=Rhizophagus clarus TaxID=94130 RepID=A0A2Z6RXK6_9GLOM|nr:hypothetical protein RclHR1_28360004 [Rhizophagus clarus]GES84369.1 hypothetical protein GLOIN_2v1766627 [Rhizophagus clarus]
MSNWARNKGFNVIKDHVDQREGVIRRRTYIYEHERSFESHSKKETSSKKISCPWRVNISCPEANNPDSAIFVNKIVDDHNHNLRIESILFEQNKRFSEEMMEDI